ncbi:hypothetical protein BGZ75_009105 [Mortierella antarctica]|nr:hypothetical protein BGZ75_009105 [Mortierella antarctica]
MPDGSAINKTCLDGHILTSSSHNDTSVVQFWDMRTGQEIGRRPDYRGRVSTLALHTVGEDRFIAIGRGDGDIGFWTLVKVDGLDSCAQEKDAGGTFSTTSKSSNLDSFKSGNSGTTTTSSRRSDNSQECLEPILIWSTAYGKLNAQSASIHGVSGLSSANMKLMKQNGAIGNHITPLQAVNAVMITNKAILQFKKRVQPNGGATRPVAEVVGEPPEEERIMGDQKNGGDRKDGGERTTAEDREE